MVVGGGCDSREERVITEREEIGEGMVMGGEARRDETRKKGRKEEERRAEQSRGEEMRGKEMR